MGRAGGRLVLHIPAAPSAAADGGKKLRRATPGRVVDGTVTSVHPLYIVATLANGASQIQRKPLCSNSPTPGQHPAQGVLPPLQQCTDAMVRWSATVRHRRGERETGAARSGHAHAIAHTPPVVRVPDDIRCVCNGMLMPRARDPDDVSLAPGPTRVCAHGDGSGTAGVLLRRAAHAQARAGGCTCRRSRMSRARAAAARWSATRCMRPCTPWCWSRAARAWCAHRTCCAPAVRGATMWQANAGSSGAVNPPTRSSSTAERIVKSAIEAAASSRPPTASAAHMAAHYLGPLAPVN